MNELTVKALHNADLLVQRMREIHRELCDDNPPPEKRIAEAHALELLEDAVRLRDRIRRITP